MPFAGAVQNGNSNVSEKTNESTTSVDDFAKNGLMKGSTGDEVILLQKWLKKQGYYTGKVDGSFGPYTALAVSYFQKDSQITVDGWVHTETIDAMVKLSGEDPFDESAAGSDNSTGNASSNYSSEDKKSYSNATTSSKTSGKKYSSKKYSTKSYSSSKTSWNRGKGTGDCWDNSEVLYKQLSSQGQKVRIIQYKTSYSSRHRSVQVYSNGQWSDYNYKANGYAVRYYATSSKPGQSVVKSN